MLKTQFQKTMRINFFSVAIVFFAMMMVMIFFLQSKGSDFYHHLKTKDAEKNIVVLLDNIKSFNSEKTIDENLRNRSKTLINFSEEIKELSPLLDSDEKSIENIDKFSVSLSNEIKNFSLTKNRTWNAYRNSVMSLFKFAELNQWKNLTIISKRAHYRTYTKYNLKENFMEILSANLKDFNSMEEVINRSSLRPQRKNMIMERVKAMIYDTNKRLEIENQLAAIKMNFSKLSGLSTSWMNKWSKKPLRVNKENNFKFIGFKDIFYLTFFTTLCLLAFYLISRKTSAHLQKSFEKDTLMLVDKVMIKGDMKYLGPHDPQFKTGVETLRNYISKRMSFGKIFQQTLPFPCVLLDKNLNVKWVNDHFSNSLKVSRDEIKNKFKKWDQLKTFFSFHGNDPIIESNANREAGIFKFKLTSSDEDSLFEIYVNPISYENDEFVMIYFNTLTPMQDAINLQVESILDSMTAIIEDLENDGELKVDRLSNEYDIPGIGKVYEKLLDFVDYTNKKSEKLQRELDDVSGILSEKYETLESVKNSTINLQNTYENMPKAMMSLKEEFVKVLENQSIYSELNEELVSTCKESMNLLDEKFENYDKIKYLAERCENWLIPELVGVREMTSEFKRKNIDTKKFEVFFSKLELLLNDMKNVNLQFEKVNTKISQGFDSKDFQSSLNLLSKSKAMSEENIISLLKEIVGSIKAFSKDMNEIEKEVEFIGNVEMIQGQDIPPSNQMNLS